MVKLEGDSIERLLSTIAELKDTEECRKFFDDLCTSKDLVEMAHRFDAAIMLNNGENYLSVSKSLGLSSVTISRVSKCLNGKAGGYQNAIAKLEKKSN